MRFSWAVLIIGIAAGCGNDTEEGVVERETPCMQLRDHTIELRLRTASGTPQQLDDMRAGLRSALGPHLLKSCESSLSPQQIECSLQASDLSEASRCEGASERQ